MNFKQVTFALVATGTVLVGSASAASADVHAQVFSPQYKSMKTGKCLDSRKNYSNTGAAAVRQVSCHPAGHKDMKHQEWVLNNDRTFRPRINSNNCLTVYGDAVVMHKCTGHKDQQWVWSGGAHGRLKNVAKKQCLSTVKGTIYFRVDKCSTGGNNRVWRRY
ncbi:hypothetical protein GCM10029978_111640 [Actinoallomurus acanthiterrae]